MSWNDFIAAAFRHVTGFVSVLLFFGCIALGGYGLVSDRMVLPMALGLLVGGPLAVIVVFGALALMIQNNRLLQQIAQARGGDRRTADKPVAKVGDRAEPRLSARP